ncbi:TetR family transcriptional regulator [Knoellia sp. S7-12]|uniref:TetR/AcrR family transcriptional regulator n=1 Tax=Knoellia sp. S7-12 TaxID=3126698 RepID=UPI0033684F2B
MSTRERALTAAVSLLAEGGLRSLTHGRIDERAGLPKGSTSNFFRTRAALVSGVMDWIIAIEAPRVAGAALPRSADGLVDALNALFELTTGPSRELTTARVVLFTEAVHNREIRDAANEGRSALEALVVPVFADLGASDPQVSATTVMACLEGLIFHRITRGDASDQRAVIELAVRAALQ